MFHCQWEMFNPALNQCSFAFGVLDGNVAKISGYLHASEKFTDAAVQTWMFDDRIHGQKAAGKSAKTEAAEG